MPRKKSKQQTPLARIESELTKQNPEIFKGISAPQKKQLIQALVSFEYRKIHQGPIPDPETLAGYEKILPGSTDRIFSSVEKQSQHRMGLEEKIVEHSMVEAKRGQIFAFIVTLFTLIAATIIILYGYIWPGSILGTGGLAIIVYLFIQGKKSQLPQNNKDSENKVEEQSTKN